MYRRISPRDRIALESSWLWDSEETIRRGVEGVELGGGECRSADYVGVKALMVAMLDEAASSLLGKLPKLRTDAEFWINSRSRRSPFAFVVVCETLGLEPSAMRRRLLEAKDRGVPVRRFLGRPRKNAKRNVRTSSGYP